MDKFSWFGLTWFGKSLSSSTTTVETSTLAITPAMAAKILGLPRKFRATLNFHVKPDSGLHVRSICSDFTLDKVPATWVNAHLVFYRDVYLWFFRRKSRFYYLKMASGGTVLDRDRLLGFEITVEEITGKSFPPNKR